MATREQSIALEGGLAEERQSPLEAARTFVESIRERLVTDTGLWLTVISTVLVVTSLRGIRFPGLWSYTHYLFSYEQGFIKRGLVGEVVRLTGIDWLRSYDAFVAFSLLLSAANAVLMVLLIRKAIRKHRSPVVMASYILFAASLAIVYLAHTIGYFEHIGLLATLTILLVPDFRRKFIVSLIALPVLLLVHEAVALMFFPVIFFSLLLAAEGQRFKERLIGLAAFGVVLIGMSTILGNMTMSEADKGQLLADTQASVDVPLRSDAFNVLGRNPRDNVRITLSKWNPDSGSVTDLVDLPTKMIGSLLVTAPVFGLFTYLGFRTVSRSATSRYIPLLVLVSALSPLLLHFLGWDMHRWNSLTITTSFLTFVTIVLYKPVDVRLMFSPVLTIAVTGLIFLSGVATIPLFDDYSVKQFPFPEHQAYLKDLVSGSESFPHVPEK